MQGGKAGAALVCTAPLRPAVCKTPCVSFLLISVLCRYVRHPDALVTARMTSLHACQTYGVFVSVRSAFLFPLFSPFLFTVRSYFFHFPL